jgi:LmbE family N-acetylglucosaminyl deacetylase
MEPYSMKPGLIGVFAHPDDEGSCSGCLARYAAEGVRAYLACATRGDGVDAKISDPSLATRETLGQVRSAELTCACEHLGINPPIFLGYQDGEVDKVPTEQAARTLARLIRELQPWVVVTHDPDGGYGHPDHIAVNAFTTRAFDLAGDAGVDLGLPAFAPAKLYYSAMPRSFLEKVPAFRDRQADIRGQKLGFRGVADEMITTAVEISAWQKVKLEALSCHRTQFEFDPETKLPKTFSTSLPEEVRALFFGHERFVLARSRVSPNGHEDDLFAGLKPF